MNECQISAALRPVDIAAFEADSNFQVLSQPGLNLVYLAYNVTHQPLNDGRVRRALDMAIDKQAIIDGVYEGHAQIAVAPLPPSQWGFDGSLKDTPRDLKKAKALLEEAGYPRGFSISLFILSVERPYNPNARLMSEMIQADWAKIGVKVNVVINEDFAKFLKSGGDGKHDAILFGMISVNGDPDDWLRLLSCTTVGSSNFSRWCHKEFEGLIQRAAQITDIAERTQLYTQAQKIFKSEQPFTPVAYVTDYQVISKHVTGFKINPLGPTIFSGVGLR
ncbi:Fragment of putative Periplasmic dipeptide transport protein precursor (Dipeptide-binding protein) (DBP)(part 2) [Candidatus Glomeribacter gigasporarum BEG34]|uniref:Fragment of putative Periplasmic dipeptide transport protein (Dipeptide-binding protein) (DBP)(Part 2) n=1 Tax=Candidatus Glomeribacter gigasporarum BEG34 TaxID=1070319 RepID=G2JB95_9BURK|nr:Fragment of putative Periplasmic dipeptide transport protein precursor (Dipeptide-binding protein) (DBP)(part 2) [Candidatus Glomeribacter gigasporarum BEG34]